MRKLDIVNNIYKQTGIPKADVILTVEYFIKEIKGSLKLGNPVFLRGFGSFILKQRAAKIGRVITKNQAIHIPAHKIASFKPCKTFANEIKSSKNL